MVVNAASGPEATPCAQRSGSESQRRLAGCSPDPEAWQRARLVGNQRPRAKVQAPGSMSLRGLRLIIGGEDRQSHGGPLALSARFTWRSQQASPLVKNPISIRATLPLPGA